MASSSSARSAALLAGDDFGVWRSAAGVLTSAAAATWTTGLRGVARRGEAGPAAAAAAAGRRDGGLRGDRMPPTAAADCAEGLAGAAASDMLASCVGRGRRTVNETAGSGANGESGADGFAAPAAAGDPGWAAEPDSEAALESGEPGNELRQWCNLLICWRRRQLKAPVWWGRRRLPQRSHRI